MRLTELLNKDEVTISCELFPPKQGAQLENYKNIVKDMAALKPAYMSCLLYTSPSPRDCS